MCLAIPALITAPRAAKLVSVGYAPRRLHPAEAGKTLVLFAGAEHIPS